MVGKTERSMLCQQRSNSQWELDHGLMKLSTRSFFRGIEGKPQENRGNEDFLMRCTCTSRLGTGINRLKRGLYQL